jgi:hypothetical protein
MPAKKHLAAAAALFLAGAVALSIWQWDRLNALVGVAASKLRKPATTEQRVAQYGDAVRQRLAPDFQKADLAYPPRHLTLVGLKAEKRLELWAGDTSVAQRLVKVYPIKAASGVAGPKLREGDSQVPEGIYAIESFNPNSRYHLALRVNYPNDADKRRAHAENRKNLGSDIMIHGKAVSIGCIAIGDTAAEELFVLAALVGKENVRILLCPWDLRLKASPPPPATPVWTAALYSELKTALATLKK